MDSEIMDPKLNAVLLVLAVGDEVKLVDWVDVRVIRGHVGSW